LSISSKEDEHNLEDYGATMPGVAAAEGRLDARSQWYYIL